MDDSYMKEDLSHDEQWDDTLLIQQYDSTMEQLRSRALQQMRNSSSGGHESSASQANSNLVHAKPAAAATAAAAPVGKKNKSKKKKNMRTEWCGQWQMGSPCRCEFSEDGELYEATVTHIDRGAGMATISYVGYGNTETVPLHKLLKSEGRAARQRQEVEAGGDGTELDHESGVGEDESSDCSSRLTAPHSRSSRCGDSAANSSSRATTSSSTASCFGAFLPDGGGVLPDLPPPPPLGMALSGLDDSEMLHTLLMSWYMTGYHTGYYRGVKAAKHRHRHH